jgi:predicted amidophosphoribosyltransferase
MKEIGYHLCPKCARAVPSTAQEKFCPNDGEKILEYCPVCEQCDLAIKMKKK